MKSCSVENSIFKNRNYSHFKDVIQSSSKSWGLFASIYQMWLEILADELSLESFRNEMLISSSRPSFVHQPTTRRRFLKRVVEFDAMIKDRDGITKNWSKIFDKHGCIFGSMSKEIGL